MNVYNFLALIALCANANPSGVLTMWSKNQDIITGSMCGYAANVIGGLNSPAITNSHYFPNRFLCAANQNRHPNSCGKCFRITYTSGGSEGNRARPGSAEIQIVDAMAADRDFDCLVDPFRQITGTDTGVMPITYEEIPCTLTDNGRSKITVMDGGNSWWTKVIVSNAKSSVKRIDMTIGQGAAQKTFTMTKSGNSASYESGNGRLTGQSGPASFAVTLWNNEMLNFNNCFVNWPVNNGVSCQTAAANGGQPTQNPTAHPTAQPTRQPTQNPTASRLLTMEPTLAPTGAAAVSTASPTNAPNGGRCYIGQCGCPGTPNWNQVAGSWCVEDVNYFKQGWCASEANCGGCSGVWCS